MPVPRKGWARLSSGWSRKRREEVAEQQRPGHVHREGRPWPRPGAVRRRLRQPDPGQRPDHAAEVDRRNPASVELPRPHGLTVSMEPPHPERGRVYSENWPDSKECGVVSKVGGVYSYPDGKGLGS